MIHGDYILRLLDLASEPRPTSEERWRRLPEDEEISIVDDAGNKTSHTAAAWVAAHGRGFLCGDF